MRQTLSHALTQIANLCSGKQLNMIEQRSRAIEYYQQAFMQFSNAVENEFQIREESGALVLFKGETYRICHYDDLLIEFKSHFTRDYTLIYTETPFDLWAILFHRHHETTDEDFIIDIFNAWSEYWHHEKHHYRHIKTYEEAKAKSRLEFNLLIDKLQVAPGDFIKNAIAISDIVLIPVIALALRSRFNDEDFFYRECVDILIETFPHIFSNDGNFDMVALRISESILDTYYIYKPDYNFEMDYK